MGQKWSLSFLRFSCLCFKHHSFLVVWEIWFFFLWKQRSSSCQSQIPQWKTNWSRLCFVIIFLGDKGATWRGWIYFWKLELYGANTRAWKFHMFPDSLLYHSSTFHLSLLFLQFLLLMNSLYRCRTEWSHNKRLTALPLAQCETHWHKCEMRKQPTVEISKSSALSYSPAVEKKKIDYITGVEIFSEAKILAHVPDYQDS